MYQKILKRLFLEFKLKPLNILKYFKQFEPQKQILIFSDPRGGSTWLTEMIHTIPDTAIIWEPFNIHEVKIIKELGFGWRQYIPENQQWPEATKVINKIFAGKVVNEWTMLSTGVIDYLSAKQLIIKICRGNMLLPWITNQINFTYTPIYLVRHPFAVVLSQMKQGGWNYQFRNFEVPCIPFNEIYKEHEDFLTSLDTKEEILTAFWCLTNQIPLNHHKNNQNWITLYYENLVVNPQKEIQQIFQKWKMQIPEGIEYVLRKKSWTTLDHVNVNVPEIQLSKWKRELNLDQVKRMSRVLKYFNVKVYNADDVFPIFNVI